MHLLKFQNLMIKNYFCVATKNKSEKKVSDCVFFSKFYLIFIKKNTINAYWLEKNKALQSP
jgi:hypothetical protein